ncbi:MAG TPA: dienelactone hydrolase family protein [Candidatus Methylacidiphilales bacterium]|nr:dienelactone hydrolase family protein [Candidatus Methylacidiphilales bacterium]
MSQKSHYPLILVIALALALANPAPAATTDTDAPAKPTGRMITLSDFGAEDLAYLAIPATPPTLGIVLVPDAYGLDDFTKAEADRLAALGYLVVAVDIYNGKQLTDPADLANLVANLDAAIVMKTVNAGIRFFHESPKFRVDNVAAMGWGTGATYVFQAARDSKTLDGAVTFYGPIETPGHPVGKFDAPLCAVYPDNDPSATHDNVLAFQQQMKAAGNDCEAWFIAAGPGWSHPKNKNYNPVEDKEAWKVALPFLIRIAAQPPKPKDDSILDKAKDKIESIFK